MEPNEPKSIAYPTESHIGIACCTGLQSFMTFQRLSNPLKIAPSRNFLAKAHGLARDSPRRSAALSLHKTGLDLVYLAQRTVLRRPANCEHANVSAASLVLVVMMNLL